METQKKGDPGKRQRARRTEEEKTAILQRVAVGEDIGETRTETCRQLDVPRSTIHSWLSETTLQEVRQGTSGEGYRHLKAAMLADFATTTQRGQAAVNTLLDRANDTKLAPKDAADLARAAREAAVATGIFADKVMVLSGQPTARTERVTASEGGLDVRSIRDALASIGISLPGPSAPVETERVNGVYQAVEHGRDSLL